MSVATTPDARDPSRLSRRAFFGVALAGASIRSRQAQTQIPPYQSLCSVYVGVQGAGIA